ncbi:MAG: methyltransferase RsmF C-terminal domain-like protein, partial [Chitinophagaceae bacterium]
DFDAGSFRQAHLELPPVSLRLNPEKIQQPGQLNFIAQNGQPVTPPLSIDPILWSAQGYYLSSRPSFTFDPLFHAGGYYVQEASSMFLEAVVRQCISHRAIRILDLCAAPGGKSTLLQSFLGVEGLLVSNEVIRSRTGIVVENLIKWGGLSVVVTQADPADFSSLHSFFDVIVVDAPCSGSGLFRKDADAIESWSPEAVNLCSQRQQRILADVFPALRNEGLLIYSTCSFSAAEDEQVVDWLANQYSVEEVPVACKAEWGIQETQTPRHHLKGYRFWPQHLRGEGLYLSVLRKKQDEVETSSSRKGNSLARVGKQEQEVCRSWLNTATDYTFYHDDEFVYAFPAAYESALLRLMQSKVRIVRAGLRMGKWVKGQLLPDVALALSTQRATLPVVVPLKLEQALRYLSRKEILPEECPATTGWLLAQYQGLSLGWLKRMDNRVNNYWPKEWRILKNPEP